MWHCIGCVCKGSAHAWRCSEAKPSARVLVAAGTIADAACLHAHQCSAYRRENLDFLNACLHAVGGYFELLAKGAVHVLVILRVLRALRPGLKIAAAGRELMGL